MKESKFVSALANAAVSKVKIIDNHAAMIASLTASVAKLTVTNKRLEGQLAEALGR